MPALALMRPFDQPDWGKESKISPQDKKNYHFQPDQLPCGDMKATAGAERKAGLPPFSSNPGLEGCRPIMTPNRDGHRKEGRASQTVFRKLKSLSCNVIIINLKYLVAFR